MLMNLQQEALTDASIFYFLPGLRLNVVKNVCVCVCVCIYIYTHIPTA